MALLNELCSKTFERKCSDALKDFTPFLITKTIEMNLNIEAFPWYLTGCPSQVDFLKRNIDIVILAMVRYQRNMITGILAILKLNSIKELLSEVSKWKSP